MKTARPNYYLTIISIAVVLLFLGIYSLIYWHPDLIADRLKEELQVVVELKEQMSAIDHDRIENEITGLEWVRPGTVELVEAEQAEREMRYELGPIAEEMETEGPFRDMMAFSLHAKYYEPVTLAMMATQLKKINGVQDVFYQEEVAQQLEISVIKWSKWAMYVGIVFAIIALILIYNTIKLALFSEKKTVLTLDMVGARKNFIKKPFLQRSAFHGGLSALIAIAIICAGLYLLGRQFEAIHELFYKESFLLWIGGMLVVGTLLQLISTEIIIRRFLSGRIQE